MILRRGIYRYGSPDLEIHVLNAFNFKDKPYIKAKLEFRYSADHKKHFELTRPKWYKLDKARISHWRVK